MHASKEECRKALKRLEVALVPLEFAGGANLRMVRAFLYAALKRLPSEAAFRADRERKWPRGLRERPRG